MKLFVIVTAAVWDQEHVDSPSRVAVDERFDNDVLMRYNDAEAEMTSRWSIYQNEPDKQATATTMAYWSGQHPWQFDCWLLQMSARRGGRWLPGRNLLYNGDDAVWPASCFYSCFTTSDCSDCAPLTSFAVRMRQVPFSRSIVNSWHVSRFIPSTAPDRRGLGA